MSTGPSMQLLIKPALGLWNEFPTDDQEVVGLTAARLATFFPDDEIFSTTFSPFC